MPKEPKDYYASMLAPGTKKISIVSRRLGTTERLVQIAVCTSEMMADRIVTALNVLQGKIEELEVPAQSMLEETRVQLTKSIAVERSLRAQLQDEKNIVTSLRSDLRHVTQERDALLAAAKRASELSQG